MSDTLSIIFWGSLLVVLYAIAVIGLILFLATLAALATLPIILIIWSIGAFL